MDPLWIFNIYGQKNNNIFNSIKKTSNNKMKQVKHLLHINHREEKP